jgi:hypothetical protein
VNVCETRTIMITASPKELRDLADKMDQLFPRLKVGDSTFVDILSYPDKNNGNVMVKLHLDQTYYESRKS